MTLRLGAFCALLVLSVFVLPEVMTGARAAPAPVIAAQSAFKAPGAGSQPPAGFATGPQAQQPQGPFGRVLQWVEDTRDYFYRQLTGAVRAFNQLDPWAAGWGLVSISLAYGILHAAGPGHGKAVISSYVLANEATARRGIVLAFLSAIVQAIVAVLLVVLASLALKAAGMQKQAAEWLETISTGAVALLGAYLLYSAVRRHWPWNAAHGHGHAHGPDCGCGHAHVPDASKLGGNFTWAQGAAVVLAVGMRPCSGAILVLIFALAQGLFWAGVASAFAMALGTAVTVSVLVGLAVGSREFAMRVLGGGKGGVWAGRIGAAAAIGGALLILVFGTLMFIVSLGPSHPFGLNNS